MKSRRTVGIKQERMSDCVPAVAAMATGTTLAEATGEMREHPDGGYDDLELLLYCARRGFLAGALQWDVDDRGGEAMLLPLNHPAYVVVKSERLEGKLHAIYWDGKQVWDPNPDAKDGRPLSEYDKEIWWPIVQSKDAPALAVERT